MQFVEPQLRRSVKKGFNGDARDFWDAQVEWPTLLALKKPVHSGKCLAGCEVFREYPVLGKSPLKSPCDENRMMLAGEMRKSSFVEIHY